MDPRALFLGTVSTATSVGITARILSEKRKMSSPEGVTILAGAVVDDVLGIILLATVVGVAKATGTGGQVPWGKVGWIAGKALGFWLVCTVVGILLAKHITHVLKKLRSNETIAAVAFGLALLLAGLAEMAGLAMVIGAYVTGLSLSQTDLVHELHERMEGLHQFLVPVFFCVMGMMVNFGALVPVALFGLVYTLLAVVAKLVGCGLPAWLMGFNLRGAVRIGAGMLPRGEVTLIVAGIGLSSGIAGPELFGVAVMSILVASVIAPPILAKAFEGGSGISAKLAGKEGDGRKTETLQMEFASAQLARFMRLRIEQAFRDEDFFVHRLSADEPLCQIRKDDIVITLVQKDARLELITTQANQQLVRFVVLEEVLELKDMLDSAKKTRSPEELASDVMGGMFVGEEQETEEKGELPTDHTDEIG
ncbi:MAG: cation:proton antiporter [Lentisphaerae bacterium]|nr:cation:proton antiporter [Lentisphaerota bacterium]